MRREKTAVQFFDGEKLVDEKFDSIVFVGITQRDEEGKKGLRTYVNAYPNLGQSLEILTGIETIKYQITESIIDSLVDGAPKEIREQMSKKEITLLANNIIETITKKASKKQIEDENLCINEYITDNLTSFILDAYLKILANREGKNNV